MYHQDYYTQQCCSLKTNLRRQNRQSTT